MNVNFRQKGVNLGCARKAARNLALNFSEPRSSNPSENFTPNSQKAAR
ncbi:hypothetical protein [uncultured Campylobacter sp.]|nr:hypothetical protein [uncultured Campylobacter sp.]